MKSSSVGENNTQNNEVEQLKALVEQLSKQVGELSKEKKQPVQRNIKEISPNSYVKVMSLVGDKLNLSTRPHGKGKTFGFEKFGQVKSMFYSELLDVIENHPNFFSAGYFRVLDENVINAGNYNEVYQKILTKEQMELIMANADGAIALFEGANEKQQKVIIQFFIDRIINGEDVDYNLISNISRISGIDIMKKVQDINETKDEIKK